jgi:heme exporter protein D
MADLARYILRLFAATFLPVITLCLLAVVDHRKTLAFRRFPSQ